MTRRSGPRPTWQDATTVNPARIAASETPPIAVELARDEPKPVGSWKRQRDRFRERQGGGTR